MSNYDFSKLDPDEVQDAVEDGDYVGFCLNCGFEQDGCEPDARNYTCESCGAEEVYGAEEILMMAPLSWYE